LAYGSSGVATRSVCEGITLGAAIAAEFVHTAWLADRFGVDRKKALADLDDWCPTKPKNPKWPPGLKTWSGGRGRLNAMPPGWPNPEPPPRPPWLLEFHLGFAAQLAAASIEFEGTALGSTLNAAIDRSIEAMVSLQKM
jgi:hypothetical protein